MSVASVEYFYLDNECDEVDCLTALSLYVHCSTQLLLWNYLSFLFLNRNFVTEFIFDSQSMDQIRTTDNHKRCPL